MGTALVLLVVLLIVLFAIRGTVKKILYGGGCCPQKEREPHIKVSDQDISHYPYHYILHIGGMTCTHCKTHVENTLNKLDGIWAKVDLPRKEADVRAKEEKEETLFRKAIWEAGYQLEGIEKV